jgi:hypothetical protein
MSVPQIAYYVRYRTDGGGEFAHSLGLNYTVRGARLCNPKGR